MIPGNFRSGFFLPPEVAESVDHRRYIVVILVKCTGDENESDTAKTEELTI